MSLPHLPRNPISTGRLILRPTGIGDADRAFEIQSDWEVTRMLRLASFPPDRLAIGAWFAEHAHEWRSGSAYRFAVEHQGRVIGLADIDEIAEGAGELGYWFEQASWGQGFATEAARALVRFAFRDIGLMKLWSGHAIDNTASAKVLRKLGFRPFDIHQKPSAARGSDIQHQRYLLSAL